MNPAQHILVFGIRLYRFTISPAKGFLLGPRGECRFEPSCSVYALEAVRRHGAWRGSWLGLRRITRCNPWGGCGHDAVPSAWVGYFSPGAKHSQADCHCAHARTNPS